MIDEVYDPEQDTRLATIQEHLRKTLWAIEDARTYDRSNTEAQMLWLVRELCQFAEEHLGRYVTTKEILP